MTIKALGNFAYDPENGEGVPADVRALDGMNVRLRGYMRVTHQANRRLTEFALVPSVRQPW